MFHLRSCVRSLAVDINHFMVLYFKEYISNKYLNKTVINIHERAEQVYKLEQSLAPNIPGASVGRHEVTLPNLT